jgi:hypothetical protein
MHMDTKNLAYSEQAMDASPILKADFLGVAQPSSGVVDSLLHPLAILIGRALTLSGRVELNLILIDDEENILQALDAGIEIHSLYYSGGAALSKELVQKLPLYTKVYEIARRTCKKIFENGKVTRVFAIAHTPVIRDLCCLLKIPRDKVS